MGLIKLLTGVEEKLLEKMEKGNSYIQLIASNGKDSTTCVGDSQMDARIILLCHITPTRKVCNGKIADKNIEYSIENEEKVPSKELRIFIDRRKSDLRLYGSSNDIPFIFKEQEEISGNDLLIAYVEDESFAQLTIFNSKLQSKISEIVTRREYMIKPIRNNAFTLITTIIPSIYNIFQEEGITELK